MLLLAAVHFLLTFLTDGRMFTSESFDFNVIIPLDGIAAKYYYVATKILTMVCLIVFYQIFFKIICAFRTKNRNMIWNFVFPLAVFLGVYLINFAICFPGVYNIDDTTLYAMTTRYFSFYWHHYLTSLFHMVGLTLFPFSSGQMVLMDGLTALTFAYIFFRLSRVLAGSKWNNLKYLLLIAALSPFINMAMLESFRTYIYSILNIFFFTYLLFEKIEKRKLTWTKFFLLALCVAVLAVWRSESIVYLAFAPFLIAITYSGSANVKKALAFTLSAVLLYAAVNIPQQMGNKKYYNNDYLITSTVRPLGVLLNLSGATDYEGGEADVEAINNVINVDYLKALPFDSISYMAWNSAINQGNLTQTMSTKEKQSAYLKSFVNILSHNKGAFLLERVELFCENNYLTGLADQCKAAFNTEFPARMNTDVDLSPYWIQEAAFKQSHITPRLMSETGRAYWTVITCQAEGVRWIYSVIPWLIMAVAVVIVAARKKAWLFFMIELAVIVREGIIALTSPAAMSSYYMPTTTLSLVLLVLLIAFGVYNKKSDKKIRLFV